ncbi:hypothetical protein, partial [Streptomyces sp. NPDC052127]|uniref:hypothetical protein n=1 Tax=Streptomyces sp. NPDC052127 TaxID=3155679 RepID=UPI0034467405
VLRLILEIEGETVTEARCGIGYLHTGIEKNLSSAASWCGAAPAGRRGKPAGKRTVRSHCRNEKGS